MTLSRAAQTRVPKALPFFDSIACNQSIDKDLFLLTDAMDSVISLRLCGVVPSWIKAIQSLVNVHPSTSVPKQRCAPDHSICLNKIQADASAFKTDDKDIRSSRFLESFENAGSSRI